jgi:RNA polymerase sigma factor (sigma-70 family)
MIVGSYKLERAISVNNESKAANDGQLIADARNDAVAFVRLYRRHYDAVFRYCVHRLFDRHIAEDVTSQVFTKAVENFQSFRGSEQQFCYWIFRIATNAVNQHLRKTLRHERMIQQTQERILDKVTANPTSADTSQEKLALLKEAILSLKPRYQTIITLRFFEKLKPTEIAEVLGSSAGTIRSQLARALAKLRKRLATDAAEVTEKF